MRATVTIANLAVSAALIATGGAVAARASAVQPRISTDGLSEINLPPDLMSSLAAAGVSLSANGGAKATSSGSTGYTTVWFPVVKPVASGVINNRGTMLMSSSTKGRLSLRNPVITFTAGSAKTATVSASVTRVVPSGATEANTTLTVFSLKNVVTRIDAGTPVKKGSGYVRKDVISVSGELFVTDNATTVKYLNAAFVKPGQKAVFAAGQSFGSLTSTFSVTVTCSTPSGCKGWTPEPE